MKQMSSLTEEQIEHLKRILTIVAKKAKFRDDFNFDQQDEPEQAFLQYRAVSLLHMH
jgi:hypothetical protein